MKRLVFLLSFTCCLLTLTSFANDDHRYPSFLKTFFTSYPAAKKVSWNEVNGMTQVSFQQDGKDQFAYYNTAGFLVITTMSLTLSEMPGTLQKSLQSYCDYHVTESYVFTKGKHRSYYVVLQKDKKQLILQSSGKKWKRFQTEL
ncbi:MAG: hypothetical protein ACXWV0_01210 [Flavisolibacter sp.]